MAWGITTTTLTNGVSFSLVAGACCIVDFSNNASTSYKNPVQLSTLNINSTGAHDVQWLRVNDTRYQSETSYLHSTIFVYTGTKYINGLIVYHDTHGYSDSD